jgi:hypothetical protein
MEIDKNFYITVVKADIFGYDEIKKKTLEQFINIMNNSISPLDARRKLKIEEDSITFISLNNSSGEAGLIKNVMNIISSVIEDNSKIFIDSDVSGGFWDYIKSKYPQYNWITL